MLCHKDWLAPSTTLPPKMARGIRRPVYRNTMDDRNLFEVFVKKVSRINLQTHYSLEFTSTFLSISISSAAYIGY